MDSITHLALGACMGEAFAGKKLGRKAGLWGAMAQSIPDIDFMASFWMDTASNLLAHRGFTHSILFCSLITPVFALLAERWHRPHNISLMRWILFFGGVIFAHILIDAFNNYGVGWFEPFSHFRMTFNAIYVADPFFTLGPVLAVIALMYLSRKNLLRRPVWMFGLGLSGFYLLYCLANKYFIDKTVRNVLSNQNITYTRYFTTPAPLQNWLWYVVAGDDRGYHVGFRSVFEDSPTMNFEYFPVNDSLLADVHDHVELDKLKRFSQGYYTVEKWGDTLVFNDLRFGQIIGWQDPKEKFVFHYFLEHSDDHTNTLVVQRGRFKNWNWDVARNFMVRIFRD